MIEKITKYSDQMLLKARKNWYVDGDKKPKSVWLKNKIIFKDTYMRKNRKIIIAIMVAALFTVNNTFIKSCVKIMQQ